MPFAVFLFFLASMHLLTAEMVLVVKHNFDDAANKPGIFTIFRQNIIYSGNITYTYYPEDHYIEYYPGGSSTIDCPCMIEKRNGVKTFVWGRGNVVEESKYVSQAVMKTTHYTFSCQEIPEPLNLIDEVYHEEFFRTGLKAAGIHSRIVCNDEGIKIYSTEEGIQWSGIMNEKIIYKSVPKDVCYSEGNTKAVSKCVYSIKFLIFFFFLSFFGKSDFDNLSKFFRSDVNPTPVNPQSPPKSSSRKPKFSNIFNLITNVIKILSFF